MADEGAKLEPSRLAKNTTYLTVASIIQKMFSFFYFIYVAKSLGPELLGQYQFALFYTSIFGIFLDLGLGPVLTREIAKRSENLTQYFRSILGIKLLMTPLWVGFLVAIIFVLRYFYPVNMDMESIYLVFWATPIILLDSLTFTFFSVFRGKQIMKYEAIGIVIYQLIIISLGSLFLFFKLPVHYVILAIIAGSAFHFLYSASLVVFVAREKLRPTWDFGFAKTILKIALPFAMAGIFFKLSGSLDSVMLKVIAGNQYVGWYAVAFKLTTALTVLPGAFATSYFPAMSQALTQGGDRAGRIFERAMVYLMIISLPIAAGTFVLADKIVIRLYDEVFGAAGDALRIFMVGLFFIFLNYPVGNLLNAANRQTLNTINMGIALVVNVGLNFWLIPNHTFIGAAISAAISSVVLLALGIPWTLKIISYNIPRLLSYSVRILGSAVVMAAFCYAMIDVRLEIIVPLSAVLYAALLIIAGVVTRHDLEMMARMVRGVVRKVV